MNIEGIRVVRGPNWSYGDDDGGEGHVGTITDNNEDDTVEVQWDMGNEGCYNTGKGNKCELRVLDSAPVGLKHTDIKCAECKASEFPGTRWNCQTCPDVNLCTLCYFQDKHSMQHPFLRIDIPGIQGAPVTKRAISNRMRALGTFKGSTVKRGRDWNYGNQDGGDGKIGTVIEINNYGTCGHERDAAKVSWPSNKDGNSYKLGYRGKVDLQCVEETPGFDYYKEHLFALNTTRVSQGVKTASIKPTPGPKPLLRRPSGGIKPPKPQLGDKVCVELPEAALKEVQRGHGGWSMRMKEYIGQHGVVKRFEDNGDCVIDYDGKEWRFNSDAIRKVPSLKTGDIVRIIDDGDKAQALQKRHGGWQQEMAVVLGKVGKVVKIDSDGDVAVAFGNKAWVFNPACCMPAAGEKMFEMSEGGGGGSGAGGGRGTGGGGAAGGGGGAGAKPTSGTADDDDEGDEAAEALAHLIAQLFLGGARASAGAGTLVAAASKNDAVTVDKLLQGNPSLVDQKHQGLTALIISSHEGHRQVVQILIKRKANLDLTEAKGNTALMAALMKNRGDVALLLIDAGANINLCNEQGRTAMHFAASNEANSVLKKLLEKGADPNKTDIAGDTPIHDAIHNKNGSGVAYLITDPRINLRICNKKGHSPLHLAALKDDEISVSRILAKAPELKDARKNDGYTALHVAAINDNTDTIKALIKANANVNSVTGQNYTPLHLAAHQGHINAAKLLVEASAAVNIQDDDGDTALHNCVGGRRNNSQSEQLARLLLGIRSSTDDEVSERTNLACFLIQQGADVNIRNKKGATALQCCSNERMRNAIASFAQRHGGSASGGGAGSQRRAAGSAADLFAMFFSDLPLPCAVCQEKVADTKFAPCGHRLCCAQCSFRVRDCPRCHTPIQARYDLEGRRLALADPCKVQ